MKVPSRPATWVFDLDGTLVDSFGHYFVLLAAIFKAHGKTFTAELRVPALTESLPDFFARHLGAENVEAAFAELQARSNEDAREILPFIGLDTLIQQLAESGARIAVWTNRDLVSARLILQHSGLEPFVELCVSGSCVQQRKPDPEGLLAIAKAFGCPIESITMVGDHEHDVTSAKSVGARTVRASWHSYWDVEKCAHADHQFHSAEEFAQWVSDQTATRSHSPEESGSQPEV